jgi:hypothetical protein
LVYQPASFAVMWLLLGWASLSVTRWIWAATSLIMLAWLVRIVVRASGAATPLERWFIALIPLSMYATGACIGNGQLILHILPLLLSGILLLHKHPISWKRDLLAAVLIAVSLVKANIGAPFFWIVIFMPCRFRPAVLALSGYLVLTGLGLWCREAPVQPHVSRQKAEIPVARMDETTAKSGDQAPKEDSSVVQRISKMAAKSGEWAGGRRVADLPIWLHRLGLGRWTLIASAAFFGLLGVWTWRNRRSDPWIQLGVTGFWTRFLTYHRWYDDLLMLPAMVALFRLAKGDPSPSHRRWAGFLLALMLPAMIAPGTLYLFPRPWCMYLELLKTALWLGVMLFLVMRTRIK